MEKPNDFGPNQDVAEEADDAIRSLEKVRQWAHEHGLKLDSNLSYIISQIERYGKQNASTRAIGATTGEQTAIRGQIACKLPGTKPSVNKQPSLPKKKRSPRNRKAPPLIWKSLQGN